MIPFKTTPSKISLKFSPPLQRRGIHPATVIARNEAILKYSVEMLSA
jgi:hypothetical protein